MLRSDKKIYNTIQTTGQVAGLVNTCAYIQIPFQLSLTSFNCKFIVIFWEVLITTEQI
jgi:hypothetical protein